MFALMEQSRFVLFTSILTAQPAVVTVYADMSVFNKKRKSRAAELQNVFCCCIGGRARVASRLNNYTLPPSAKPRKRASQLALAYLMSQNPHLQLLFHQIYILAVIILFV